MDPAPKRKTPKISPWAKAFPDLLFFIDRDGLTQGIDEQPLGSALVAPLAARIRPLVRKALDASTPLRRDYKLRQGGQWREVEVRLAPASGGLALCVVRDLTHERELARMALSSERQVAVGRVSASLAHEIRNPVAIISGAAQILHEGWSDSPRAMRQVQRILEQCERLGRLVDSVLGQAIPRREAPVRASLAALLEEAVTLSAIQYGAAASSLSVKIEVHPAGAAILCESRKILQVLVNLVLNALQAMDGQGELRLSGELMDGGGARLCVRDNGPGVPAQNRLHIFNLFFTTKANGSGIGLAVSRQLSRSMGGELYHRSPAPGGAEFVLSLPSAKAVPPKRGQERP